MTDAELTKFLDVADVAEILKISVSDVHALVTSGELASIRVGSNGPIRIELRELEAFIAHQYDVEQRLRRLRQAEFTNVTDFTDGRLL